VKDPLNDNGITLLQPQTARDGKNYVETVLLHSSGEWISGETEIVCAKQNDPQASGSAQTYARRFGLQSLISIPAEDDDGNFSSGREVPKAAAKAYTKPVVYATSPLAAVTKEELSKEATPAEALQSLALAAPSEKKAPSFKKSAPASTSAPAAIAAKDEGLAW
jgi:hypothetical protein